MIDRGRHNVLGVRIDAVDYDAAVERLIAAARERRPLGATALAVHGVMTGARDRQHRHRLNRLDLVVPDGQPVRWALNRLYGTGLTDRVYGPNLTLRVCEQAAREGLPVFLFGSTAEMLERLSANLTARFPGFRIAGVQASQFRRLNEDERWPVVRKIRESGAQLTLVGLGCPRQEVWTYEFVEALSMPVLAVGAAFAFHAGMLAQAPPTLQRLGLEWLFRLAKEPTRLWRRYLFLNPIYLALLGLQWSGLYTVDPEDTEPPRELLLYG